VRYLVVGSVGLVGLFAAGCQPASPEPETERPLGVSVQPARMAPLRDVATASGMVVASAAGEWTIYAPGPAQIALMPKKESDSVEAGEVLVRFDVAAVTDALNARQNALTEASARAERAKAEFERLSGLFERGIASRNAYEAARAEQTTSASILAQAAADLEAVKAEQAQATIRARFGGIVAQVWHAEGEFVSGSQTDPVLQVIDPTRLQVAAELPISQLARIVPGQAVQVLAIGADAPIAASVASKPATVDPNAPTGQVRIALPTPTTLPLKTPVSVEILLDQRANALVVPVEAVQRDDLSPFVMVAGADGRAHRRDVRTGLVTRTLTEIVTGLEAGERVIVGGVEDVTEGTAIAFTE
jgi:RND family efflux transporter MFP subunit